MKMLDTLQEEIASLDQFPNRVPLTEEEPWHSQGIHRFPVKNYLVYFWVDEETKKVQIIGAVYGRKNQRHRLSNLDMFRNGGDRVSMQNLKDVVAWYEQETGRKL